MIRGLLAFLRGWVLVEVRSADVPQLLSRLAAAGLSAAGVRWRPEGAEWRMTVPAARQLHSAARGLRVRVHFGRRGGWPAVWHRMRTRPGLWLGVAMALSLVGYAAPRVWVVAVVGTTPVMAARVLSAADAAGLSAGVPRDTLPLARLESRIAQHVPGVAWVGIRVEGALAVVSLHRFYGRAPHAGPVRLLVAARAARIVRIHAYLGEVLVADGEAVGRGAPLIRSWTLATGQQGGVGGEVIGQFGLAGTGFQSLTLDRRRQTGRRMVRSYVALSGDVVQWSGFGPVPPAWQATVQSAPLVWFGIHLPGAWVRVVYTEEAVVPVRLSPHAALARAREQAARAFWRQIQPGARVGARRMTCQREASGVLCTVRAEVEQDIAVPAFRLPTKSP